MRAFIVLLGVLPCLVGCQACESPEAPAPPPKAPSVPAPARPATFQPRELSELRAFVERWVKAQNDSSWSDYEALYAEDFEGTKRTGAAATSMTRAEWLADRKALATRTPRVAAKDLHFLRDADLFVVEFEQLWSTDTFADRGQKLLSLRRTPSGLVIVREQMLSSEVLGEQQRATDPNFYGQCARLWEFGEPSATHEIWRLANLDEFEAAGWRVVTDWESARAAAKTGEIWLSAVVHRSEGWLGIDESLFHPSGDAVNTERHCYRPDGSLALHEDILRTFFSTEGLAEDVRTTSFGPDGQQTGARHTVRAMNGKPLDAVAFLPEPSVPKRRLGDFAFTAALPAELLR